MARKLLVFALSLILIVCTFVVVSSAKEVSDASYEYDTVIRTGTTYKYYALNDDWSLENNQIRPLYFVNDNIAVAYFVIYDIDRGSFVDGTYYVLSVQYDEQSQSAIFTARGSQYPAGVSGDYTSSSYSFSGNYAIIWYGDTSSSFASDLQSYDWFCDSFQIVSLNDILGGLGYQDGFNIGYNSGFTDGFNQGVLNGYVSLSVGENSVYISPSELTSRFYIRWYSEEDSFYYTIFGDGTSIFYVKNITEDLSSATVIDTLYTSDRGWLGGYGPILNLPLNVLRPSRYATIFIPSFATIETDRGNLVSAITLLDYTVLNDSYIEPLGDVYMKLGYDDGLEVGNERGFNRGYSSGYTDGYNLGLFDGSSNSNPKTFNKLGAFLVNSVGSFLDTELFYGFNIGHVLAIIVGASLFFLLIRLLR